MDSHSHHHSSEEESHSHHHTSEEKSADLSDEENKQDKIHSEAPRVSESSDEFEHMLHEIHPMKNATFKQVFPVLSMLRSTPKKKKVWSN